MLSRCSGVDVYVNNDVDVDVHVDVDVDVEELEIVGQLEAFNELDVKKVEARGCPLENEGIKGAALALISLSETFFYFIPFSSSSFVLSYNLFPSFEDNGFK